METTLKITGNYNELKTKLKQKYSNLTDEDLTFSPGKEGELVTRLSKKLGKTEDEITDVIDELQSSQKEGMNKTEKSETERKQSGTKQEREKGEEEEITPTSGKESSKKY